MRPLQDTQNKFPRSIWGVSSFYKIQLARNNWKIKGIFSGLVTRRHYFLKKYDAKQPNFPSCRNWPICPVGQHLSFTWSDCDRHTVEHVRWPNNGALHTSHKASTPSWGCGSQPVVQVSTFHVFFRKANLNQLDVGNMSPLQRPRPHRTQPHHSCSRICSDLFWQFSSGQTYVVESVRCHEHKRRKVIGNLLGFYHVHGYWMNISCRISQGLWSAANSDCNG